MISGDNILVIVPSMVPRITSWGGSQRMYYLANTLSESDKNVVTISPKYKEAEEYKEKEISYKPIYLGGEITNEKKETNIIKKIVFRLLKHVIYMIDYFLYSEPSRFSGVFHKRWIRQNEEEIWDIIYRYEIGKVIISGPSFSLFSLAPKIKKRNKNIKVILDYRDPWHLWKQKKNWAYYKERKYLEYADSVICFSESFQRDMCKAFHLDMDKVKTIYNGYSENEWNLIPKETNESETLIISFVGTMDFGDNAMNYRNPNRLMEMVKMLPEGVVELQFVGVDEDRIDREEKNIKFIKKVTQQESFAYMMKSDVLLNIHDTDDFSGKYIISGKFYDYMKSGKVIWDIGKKDNLSAKFISEYGLGIHCENDSNQIKKLLNLMIELKQKKRIMDLRNGDKKCIMEFSRESQNHKYIEIVRLVE